MRIGSFVICHHAQVVLRVPSVKHKSAARDTLTLLPGRSLRVLSLPASFSCLLERFQSFTHPHWSLPAAPDGLPARHPVVLASQEAAQTRHGHQHALARPSARKGSPNFAAN